MKVFHLWWIRSTSASTNAPKWLSAEFSANITMNQPLRKVGAFY